MIDKIKQNPRIFLGVLAIVFFVAAIPFMALKAFAITINTEGVSTVVYASVFALIFGGKYFTEGRMDDIFMKAEGKQLEANALLVTSFILLIVIIIALLVLVFGLASNSFNKKTSIIFVSVITLLAVVSAILLFVSKEMTLYEYAKSQAGSSATAEKIQKQLDTIKETVKSLNGSINLGAGCIVPAILSLLGAGSLGGIIFLSCKDK